MTRSRIPAKPVRPFTSFSNAFWAEAVRNTGGFCASLFMRTDRAGLSEVSPVSVVHAKNDRTAAFKRCTDAGDLAPESVVKSSGEDKARSSRPGVTSWQQSPGWKDSTTQATSRRSRRYAVTVPAALFSADRWAQNRSMVASSRSLLFGIGHLRLLAVSHWGAFGQRELIDKSGILSPDQHHPKHADGLGDGSLGPGITISELQQRIAFEELANLSDTQLLKLLVFAEVSLDEIEVLPVGVERPLLFAVLPKMVDEGGCGS